MSTDTHAPVDDHEEDAPHGSLRGYLAGFGLSAALTAAAFALAMTGALSRQWSVLGISLLAAVQVVVHMVFFLHMNRRAEGGWSMMALIFTAVVIVIALSGSLWVMYHMNLNMMPAGDMSQMG